MSVSMVGSKGWNFIDLLTQEDCEIIKPLGNASAFDKDNDLHLVSRFARGIEKVSIRFAPPVRYYSFIEIDIVASSAAVQLNISSATNADPVNIFYGEVATVVGAATTGRTRTYRLPATAEIECLIFVGFGVDNPVTVKAVRFFSPNPELCCFASPVFGTEFPTNSAILQLFRPFTYDELTETYNDYAEIAYERWGEYSDLAPENNRYLIPLDAGMGTVVRVAFTMDGLIRSVGAVRITQEVNVGQDIFVGFIDQLGISLPLSVSSARITVPVTLEKQIMEFTLQNLSPFDATFAMFELFIYGLRKHIAAFGCVERNDVCC